MDLSLNKMIGDRLQRIANILLLNSSFLDNPGLLNGKMGIAIFFYHYGRIAGKKTYEDYAGELVDEIYEEINTSTPVNFENGLTGIGWGIEYLVKNGFVHADTDEALEEVDNIVYSNSINRPILIDSGKDLFGYGLYYLVRLEQKGHDNNNLKTLFKKQHLIYLTDECERILIQKKFLDFRIESLGLDAINSFTWFAIEMHRWGLFPFKVQKLFKALMEYQKFHAKNSNDPSRVRQMIKLNKSMVACAMYNEIKDKADSILYQPLNIKFGKERIQEDEVKTFINDVWQNLIFEPYVHDYDEVYINLDKIFRIINNEENWINRLDNISPDNIGLTGLTGIGFGLMRSKNSNYRI